MTQKQILLREPNMERRSGYGSYRFTVLKNGKKISIDTNDSVFWDEWKSCEWQSRKYFGMARRIIKMFSNYGQVI